MTLAIQLTKPIRTVSILDHPDDIPGGVNPTVPGAAEMPSAPQAEAVHSEALELAQQQLEQSRQLLNNLVAKLNDFYDSTLSLHKDDLASLAVEIARKILVQKVRDRDYEIEAIITEALSHAPLAADIQILVSPEDLETCLSLQQAQPDSALAKLSFSADPQIALAECRIETPKGSIHSSIESHLNRIATALTKAPSS